MPPSCPCPSAPYLSRPRPKGQSESPCSEWGWERSSPYPLRRRAPRATTRARQIREGRRKARQNRGAREPAWAREALRQPPVRLFRPNASSGLRVRGRFRDRAVGGFPKVVPHAVCVLNWMRFRKVCPFCPYAAHLRFCGAFRFSWARRKGSFRAIRFS